jgi:hypothetical protein
MDASRTAQNLSPCNQSASDMDVLGGKGYAGMQQSMCLPVVLVNSADLPIKEGLLIFHGTLLVFNTIPSA